MNANMNRVMLAVLGGIAGVSLAIILAPGSRRERERLGRFAGDVGEGLRMRLRSTPLMGTGQDVARMVAQRAQEAAHRAQEAVGRVRGVSRGEGRVAGEAAAEALEQASEAATRALDAVEELVKRTEDVIERTRKKSRD